MAARRKARPLVLIAAVLALLASAFAAFVWWNQRSVPEGTLSLERKSFGDLRGWQGSDARAALAAFGRTCTQLLQKPPSDALTGTGYGGTVADWTPACQRLA